MAKRAEALTRLAADIRQTFERVAFGGFSALDEAPQPTDAINEQQGEEGGEDGLGAFRV